MCNTTHIAYKGAYPLLLGQFGTNEAYFYTYKCHKQCQIGEFTIKNEHFDPNDLDL